MGGYKEQRKGLTACLVLVQLRLRFVALYIFYREVLT